MMEQKYRREMDRVELSPDQRARIVQAMVEEPPRKQRRRPPVRLLIAAALVCGVLTTSALALSPALRDYLAQALGSFTSYSQEPEGAAAADQNIEIRVVSAVTDQYRMKIYVEAQDLTGEYFTDDRILMWWKIPREWGSTSVSSAPSAIAYDPETHTALFELDMSGYRRAEVRVAAHCAADVFRAPWRKRDLPLEAAAGASVPPPEEPDGSVLSAVLALPEKYRLPVHLFYYEGYSIKEAAAILGRREGTVRAQLTRARAMLRDRLEAERT